MTIAEEEIIKRLEDIRTALVKLCEILERLVLATRSK